MTGSTLTTSNDAVVLVPIEIERDAPLGVQWLKGPTGRDTLQKMGVTDEYNHESNLEAEKTRLHKMLDDPQEIAWMISLNNRVVGVTEVHLDEFEGLAGPNIHIMLGDPAARGQGIGTAVFETVLNYLQAEVNAHKVYSRHLISNNGSAALLAKLSFIQDGEEYADADGLQWQNMVRG